MRSSKEINIEYAEVSARIGTLVFGKKDSEAQIASFDKQMEVAYQRILQLRQEYDQALAAEKGAAVPTVVEEVKNPASK